MQIGCLKAPKQIQTEAVGEQVHAPTPLLVIEPVDHDMHPSIVISPLVVDTLAALMRSRSLSQMSRAWHNQVMVAGLLCSENYVADMEQKEVRPSMALVDRPDVCECAYQLGIIMALRRQAQQVFQVVGELVGANLQGPDNNSIGMLHVYNDSFPLMLAVLKDILNFGFLDWVSAYLEQPQRRLLEMDFELMDSMAIQLQKAQQLALKLLAGLLASSDFPEPN